MARLSLLALAVALVALVLASPAAAQVSVQAPFTNVNVGSNSDNQDGWHTGHCMPHHSWWLAHRRCPGGLFYASLTGEKMIPAPIETSARGWAWVCVVDNEGDGGGKSIVTRLTLCDIKGYVASHHHFGGPDVDFPPPIVAIEPSQKPADPTAPPTALPLLDPPVDVSSNGGSGHHWHHHKKCRTVEVTSSAQDLIVVPGGPQTWGELFQAAADGKVYVNAHTLAHPSGEIRGNLERCGA
jgi:hypothetical protein